jgi:hypothetical protein
MCNAPNRISTGVWRKALYISDSAEFFSNRASRVTKIKTIPDEDSFLINSSKKFMFDLLPSVVFYKVDCAKKSGKSAIIPISSGCRTIIRR